MGPWTMALLDLLAIIFGLLVFALFHHVLPTWFPRQRIPEPVAISTPAPQEIVPVPAAEAETPETTPTPQRSGMWGERYAEQFTDGEVIQTENSYQSANLNITLTRYDFNIDDYEQAVYVQDIYVRSIDCFHRCFAEDTYGKAITEGVLSMANRRNAVAAVNGDYYGHNNGGIVICDGVMYRDDFGADIQTLILFRDGTMKGYNKASEFDAQQVMADGAWQSFCARPTREGRRRDC